MLPNMGNNKWMYHAAYGVLMLGALLALIFSEKPLSATVVNLALFSFNMAAVVLVMPAVLNFMARMKEKSDRAEADIMLQLKEIKARIMILSNATTKAGQALPLKNALEGTASATQLTAEDLTEKTPAPTHSSSPSFSHASLQSVHNAAPISGTQSTGAAATRIKNNFGSTLSTADSIFSQPRVTIMPKPAPTPAPSVTLHSTTAPVEQPSLFANLGEALERVNVQNTPPATSATPTPAEAVLLIKIHVEEDDVLCLRGEGAGLNWQEGLPLSYIGEDQWRWSAQLTQPITCRVYLNDEISAFGDDIALEPGKTLEVSPSFPKVDA